MKPIFITYRVVYSVVAVIVLVGLLRTAFIREYGSATEILLTLLLACALLFAIVAAFVFTRIAPSVMLIGIVALCALIAWYGWYGPTTPFVQHELHTFDPANAAVESDRFRLYTGISYVVMTIWLLSLPFARMVWKNRTSGV